LHARTHQVLSELIPTIEVDQAIRIVDAHHAVRNRRLAYGETVEPSEQAHGFAYEPLLLAESLLRRIGFPSDDEFYLMEEHEVTSLIEYVISDMLLPFAQTKLSAMSEKTRRSLYQELQGIAPSRGRVLLSAKSQRGGVLGPRTSSPIERHLAEMLGIHRISAVELNALTEQICSTAGLPFDSRRNLKDSTKAEVLDWIQERWNSLGTTEAMICLTRRRSPPIQSEQARTRVIDLGK
jgi:hypothetical protein